MTGTSALAAWANFNVGTASAAAALTGLFIVAMSVNVKEILAGEALPARAGATIGALTLVIITSILSLVPGQDIRWLGAEVVFATCCAGVLQVISARRILLQTPRRPLAESIPKIVAGGGQLVPFLIGGIFLLGGVAGGAGGIAAGVALVFAISIYNSWILLIEILR